MWQVLLGVVRSSVFLTAYCGTAWGGACTLQHIVKHARPWTVAAGASAAGLATLLEKKSRRMVCTHVKSPPTAVKSPLSAVKSQKLNLKNPQNPTKKPKHGPQPASPPCSKKVPPHKK
jgi:hypothetical protein